MASPLEPRLAVLLTRLIELDAGNYETFHPYFSGESGAEAELIGFDDQLIPEGPTKELATRGYLEMDAHPGKRLGNFRLSELGHKTAAQIAGEGEGVVDLAWSAVEPVLAGIHDAWRGEGAPTLGLNGEVLTEKLGMTPEQLSPVLSALEDDDWIECRRALGRSLPRGIRPSAKAIRFLNAWPKGDGTEFGKEVLARLEERVEAEPDPEERSKLQATLAQGGTGFRELLVEVMAAIASRQMGA
jgi:hypothetical protein